MLSGIKHLIKCRCILPQFRGRIPPIFHQFTVFSVLEDDEVKEKHVECPNCGVIHQVTGISQSNVMTGHELSSSVMSIDDLRLTLDERLVNILERNNADLSSWEAVSFIIENQKWNDFVVLSTEEVDGMKVGKILWILGERLFKVESFSKKVDVDLGQT